MLTSLTGRFTPGNGFKAVPRAQQEPFAGTFTGELAGNCFSAELPVGSWQGKMEMGMGQTQLPQLRDWHSIHKRENNLQPLERVRKE